MKFYKVKTVLKYCYSSWRNSAFIKDKFNQNQIVTYFDLVYCFLRYGADFNDYCTFEFWKKTNQERDSYISLRRNDVLRFSFSTRSVYQLFLDKAAFNERFHKYIKRGWITTEGYSFEEIETFISRYDGVIVKPLSDYGGKGVFLIQPKMDDYQEKMNRLKILINKDKYIIEEFVTNCDSLKEIAPGSLNTLRFVTVIDKDNKLHIIASLLRMGNGISITDNYHDGGMACAIDLATGKMKGEAKGMHCMSYAIHPYSKIVFEGFSVQNFFKCVDLIKEIAFVEPEARYVGWDIALTPDGIELLEENIPPGEDITQIASGGGMWHKMLEWK